MKYVPVQAVSVFLWGRRVGVLAHAYDAYSQFEYDPDFRRTGLEIAPLAMPLSRALYVADEFELPRRAQFGLPGVFADSLPDSFGQRLIGKWMESHGVDLRDITPLDRLSYVGARGMGALTYEPEVRADRLPVSALDMRRLVEEARLAVRLGLAPADWPDSVAAAFAKAGLPTALPDGITFESLAEIMRHDKKQRGGKILFALPCAPGDVRLVPVAV